LTRRQDFALAVRRGRRAARPTLIVHLLTDATTPVPAVASGAGMQDSPAPVGGAPAARSARSEPAEPARSHRAPSVSAVLAGRAPQNPTAHPRSAPATPVPTRATTSAESARSHRAISVPAVSPGSAPAASVPSGVPPPAAVPRVGFVVGRTVGGSVDRHRVVRRLRHLVRDRLDRLPPASLVVVRALPAARDADSAALARDLDAALRRLLPAAPASRPSDPGTPRVMTS
jgi:ribonuclease P protein component